MKTSLPSESAHLIALLYYIAGLLQHEDWTTNRILMWSLAAYWFINAFVRGWKGNK